jgi:Protein of unknown function (DUF1574)
MRTRARHVRARRVLLWALLSLAAGHAWFLLATEYWHPEWRDPEFGYRLQMLQTRRAKQPCRPLLVALGSSRTQLAFRPSVVNRVLAEDGEPPVTFNFSMVGAGPVLELLSLHRLLDAGLRPDYLVLEVLPPLLHQEGSYCEDTWINLLRLGWRDWRHVYTYFTAGRQFRRHTLRHQLIPWYTFRHEILTPLLPRFLPQGARKDVWRWYLDRTGWMTRRDAATAEERRHATEHARREYYRPLQEFHITASADRPLRDTLALCRREGIQVVLVVAPEGSEFRGWYPAPAWPEIEAYLDGLRREYGVPLVNARCWIDDADLIDGHHVFERGADRFSERLAREALRPLLRPLKR